MAASKPQRQGHLIKRILSKKIIGVAIEIEIEIASNYNNNMFDPDFDSDFDFEMTLPPNVVKASNLALKTMVTKK